jgi:hypothetical protein
MAYRDPQDFQVSRDYREPLGLQELLDKMEHQEPLVNKDYREQQDPQASVSVILYVPHP